MKTLSSVQKIYLGSFALASALVLSIFFNSLDSSNTHDPLKEVLLGEESVHSPFVADFLTQSLFPYNGEISDSLFSCMEENHTFGEEKIYAQFNPEGSLPSSREEILDQINPVLGHAVRHNQVNWIYNQDKQEYTFYTAPGDEVMWQCYFKNETEFFKEFFKPESIYMEKRTGVSLSFNDSKSTIATAEAIRNTWTFAMENAEEQILDLGVLNIESASEWKNSFLDSLIDGETYKIPLNENILISSSSEVVRNKEYPFLSVLTSSSNEASRPFVKTSILSLNLTPLSPDSPDMEYFKASLSINPQYVQNANNYSFAVSTSLFPVFTDSLNTPLNSYFLSNRSKRISVYTEESEFCPIPDLANPPEGCFWESVEDDLSIPGCVIPQYELACE